MIVRVRGKFLILHRKLILKSNYQISNFGIIDRLCKTKKKSDSNITDLLVTFDPKTYSTGAHKAQYLATGQFIFVEKRCNDERKNTK